MRRKLLRAALAFALVCRAGAAVALDPGTGTSISNAAVNVTTLTLTDKFYLPAAGCNNTTATALLDLPTANAPAAACVTGANIQRGTLDFDATTDESAQSAFVLPTDFTGAIDVEYWWIAAATTGAVGWCTQLVCIADSEPNNPAFPAQGAGNCVSDTVDGITTDMNRTTDTSITATGCAADEMVQIRISRDANGGAVTDSMTGDARLIGVMLTIRRAQAQ